MTMPEEPIESTQSDATPVETLAAPEARPDIEDTIREAYRASQRPEGEQEEGSAARQRDPSGRFTRPAEQAATAGEVPFIAKKPHDEYPVSWQREFADQWGALPESVRQQVYKREQDFHQGISQYKEAAAVGNALWDSIGPHVDTMRQMGATPQQVVNELMGLWHTMVSGAPEQRRETLLRIAQQAGIDISGAPSASTDLQGQPPDLNPALQRIAQIEQRLQQDEQGRRQAEFTTLLNQVKTFQGDPKNEHFDLVADEMLAMIRSRYANNLADAYDKACRLSPAVQAKAAEKTAAEQARQAADKAAAARRAAAVNVTRRGTAPTAPQKGTMEDTIRENYRRLNG
jgi:hypothetical protein